MEALRSFEGQKALNDILQLPGSRAGTVVHLNAPLEDGSVVKFDIIRRQNAAIARILPESPTFTVRCIKFFMDPNGRPLPDDHGSPLVKDVEPIEAFASKEAAVRSVAALLRELKEENDPPILQVIYPVPAELQDTYAIIERAPPRGQRYDDAIIIYQDQVSDESEDRACGQLPCSSAVAFLWIQCSGPRYAALQYADFLPPKWLVNASWPVSKGVGLTVYSQ